MWTEDFMQFELTATEGSGEQFLPRRATPGSACLDCKANISDPLMIPPNRTRVVPLGFRVRIPRGWFLEVRGRSGMASHASVLSHVGTVDADFYPGEVSAILYNGFGEAVIIRPGDRVAQVRPARDWTIFLPERALEVRPSICLEPLQAERVGGYGSTGR